jgi:hypothetical protein
LKTAQVAISVVVMLLISAGCESEGLPGSWPVAGGGDVLGAYAASKIRVVGLSEITNASDDERTSGVKVYVDLLDSFGNRIKSPGVFRFELYEFVPRSSEPKGKRIFIQPDIDLTDATRNNSHWRDFLRTYQFDLDLNFKVKANDAFMLEVTFITPAGKRLRGLFQLEPEKQ